MPGEHVDHHRQAFVAKLTPEGQRRGLGRPHMVGGEERAPERQDPN